MYVLNMFQHRERNIKGGKMATQSASKPVSMGICEFCKAEIAKNKVTQHLKFCKQRRAMIDELEKQSEATKMRLFHIVAEGHYNPQYWFHFELPAEASLGLIDDFLKAMWVDDLDHLSGFKINDTHYGNDYPGGYYFFSGEKEAEEEEEEEAPSDEEIVQKVGKVVEEDLPDLEERIVSLASGKGGSVESLTALQSFKEWVAEIKKPRSLDELIDFLKAERLRVEKASKAAVKQGDTGIPRYVEHINFVVLHHQKFTIDELLDMIEDQSLDALLQRVLKVGQKFSYIYDYGSSTYIDLKVVGEREGIVQDESDAVQLLAQNIAPEFACVKCGKPATVVVQGYYYGSIADNVYCNECAKAKSREYFEKGDAEEGAVIILDEEEEEEEEDLDEDIEEEEDVYAIGDGRWLPIINSPRVGVL
jgi:hypothetical protein